MPRLLPLLALLALCLLAAVDAAPAAPAAAVVREDGDVDHSQHSAEEHEAAMAKEKAEGEDGHEGHDHGDHEGHDHAEGATEDEKDAEDAAAKKADDDDHEGHDHDDHEGHDHDEGMTEEEKDAEDAAAKKADDDDHEGHDHDEGMTEEEKDAEDEAAAAEAANAEGENNTCFPGDATVTLSSGVSVRMDALAVGDVVHVGRGVYSPVFMFTHKDADAAAAYVRIATASGAALTATRSHFVHANGRLVAAGAVRVGDAMVRADSGAPDIVVAVGPASGRGLYNPQTLHGDVAVGGLVASAYTRAVEPAAAHALLAPARALWTLLGWTSAAFEHGSRFAGALPVQSVVA